MLSRAGALGVPVLATSIAGAARDPRGLDNYIRIDLHLQTNDPEFQDVIRELTEHVAGTVCPPPSADQLHLQVGTVLLNAVAAYAKDPAVWVAYSRNRNNYYGAEDRYNPLKVRPLGATVDALAKLGYLDTAIGFLDRGTNVGRLSRYRSTEALLRLLPHDAFGDWDTDQTNTKTPLGSPPLNPSWVCAAVGQVKDRECIILRNINPRNLRKEDVGYHDTEAIIGMRTRLMAYNALMEKTEIRLSHALTGVDLTRKVTFRKFSNGSFEDGGRFYGPWWVTIPSAARRSLLINGEPVVEIDYSALHPTLLCLMAGVAPNGPGAFDPYTIPGLSPGGQMRAVLKLLVLVGLNAENRTAALHGLNGRLRDEGLWEWFEEQGLKAGPLIDMYISARPEVGRHFYTKAWTWLQRLDSSMAEGVMEHFTSIRVPALMVHDSFVVQSKHAAELEGVMAQVLRNTMVSQLGCAKDFANTITPKMKTIRPRCGNAPH